MQLERLKLQNFRQHADSEIDFSKGITGIIGPNGSGKSTLLEAIAWVIYGTRATRGTRETLRFSHAGEKARVEVELEFSLGGHHYKVVRGLNDARVYLDQGTEPVAATTGGVTTYLEGRIGMTQEEFFNTYFTTQKELQFLATMGPTERGKFLSRVLGYDKLREAQEALRVRRAEIKHEISSIERLVEPEEDVKKRKEAAERELEKIQTRLQASEEKLVELKEKIEVEEPKLTSASELKEKREKLEGEIKEEERELQETKKEIVRLEESLGKLEEMGVRESELEDELEGINALDEQLEEMDQARQRHAERVALKEQLEEATSRLEERTERMDKLQSAPELKTQFEQELEAASQRMETLEQEIQKTQVEWVEEKSEVKSRYGTLVARKRDLDEHLGVIEDAGPEGACIVCERPLGEEYEHVHDQLHDEQEKAGEEIEALREKAETLKHEPKALVERKKELETLKEKKATLARKVARSEAAVVELAEVRKVVEVEREKVERLKTRLENIGNGYDKNEHQKLREQKTRLEGLKGQLQEIKKATAQKKEVEEKKSTFEDKLLVQKEAREELQAALVELEEIPQDMYEKMVKALSELQESRQKLEIDVAESKAEEKIRESNLVDAEEALKRNRGHMAELEELRVELLYHNELDEIFTNARAEMNERLRPELAEVAGSLLSELTDGRYTSLEIDENYQMLVIESGEEKPVISGGEEDVVNLALRIALSQMIAERAGHPLSLLILDEVFGSLDVVRRINVVELLGRLQTHFEQVILVTHVEEIRDRVNSVVEVRLNEQTGSSEVNSMSTGLGAEVFAGGV